MSVLAGRLSLAGLVALALGGATSYLQTVLPYAVAPLANSAGSWCVVAFVLARRGLRVGEGSVTGVLSLVALVTGYYLAAHVRGFAVSEASAAFWCAAAVTIGPMLGAAAVVVRRSQGWSRLAAAFVLPLLLVGEGIRSLVVIADSTPPAYWIGQILLGVLVLGVTAGPRPRGSHPGGSGLFAESEAVPWSEHVGCQEGSEGRAGRTRRPRGV